MVLAGEVGEVVGAESAVARRGVAEGEEGIGDLVGPVRFDEADMRRAGQHAGNSAPAGRDDRQVVRERFDERERLALVRIGGGETEDVGGGEELVLARVVGEAGVADEVFAERGGLGAERGGLGGAGETAGDGEPERPGLAGVREGECGESVEEAFGAGAEAEEKNLSGLTRGRRCGADDSESRPYLEAVGDDRGAAGREDLGVGGQFGGEDEGEIGAAEEKARQRTFGSMLGEPLAEADGVPVQDEPRKKRAAKQHHEEVAIERAAFSGRGNVVEGHRPVAGAERERAEAGGEERGEFARAPAADVGEVTGEARVDVMEFELGRSDGQTGDEGLHHEALAVDGRRRVSEDEELQRGRHGG